MKVKYIGPTCVSLINGKEYDVLAIEKTCYRIIDETYHKMSAEELIEHAEIIEKRYEI